MARLADLARRIKARLIQPFDVVLGRIYNHRHPGVVEQRLISLFRPLVLLCQPNDKWNLHVLAPVWVQAVTCAPIKPLPPAKSLFIYVSYRGVFTHQIVLASLLAWRGHKITIGYMPKLGSVNKPPFEDHPSTKAYLHRALRDISTITGGRITCIDLSDNIIPVEVDEEKAKKQAHYDTVMTYQMERLDFDDPAVSAIYKRLVKTGMKTQEVVRSHFTQNSYDIGLVGNGTHFDSSQFCHVLGDLGVDFNAFEKFAFRGVRCMNHGGHFLNGDDIDFIWENREVLGYTAEPYLSLFKQQSLKAITERSRNSVETWLWELQRAPDQSTDDALAQAGIPTERPFILVCPNVVFDAGYGKITNVFPSMKDWLLKTVQYLLENTDTLIVVRAHPGEGLWWGGREPCHEFLAEHGLTTGDNLIVIAGQDKVNTYRLMNSCKFGVVFSSSTGLEMAAFGKHVVTGGDVVYSRKGYTYDADTQEEYFENLNKLGGTDTLAPLSEDRRTLALLFYFVYHWVAQYPYPYDKPSAIARLRPRELVQAKGMEKYVPYFDLLSMDRREFHAAINDYLGANQIHERLKSINALQ